MNILVLMCDQLRYDALSCYGNPVIQTPNLDRLKESSVDFTREYTTSPVCGPARYTLATGVLPYMHGVTSNPKLAHQPIHTIAHVLKAAGYSSANIGHMHWNDEDTFDTGYDERLAKGVEGIDMSWRQVKRFNWETPSGFSDALIGGPSNRNCRQYWGENVKNETIRKLKEYKQQQKKFFLWSSFNEPHPPFFAPRELYEAIDKSKIPDADVQPESLSIVPFMADKKSEFAHLTQYEYKQIQAAYFALVKLADNYIGEIFSVMDELDLWKDTAVLFMVDHGEMLGDQGLFSKFVFRESAVHLPFMLYHPCLKPGSCDALVSHLDVFPTLCDIAGVSCPENAQGHSLMKLLSGKEKTLHQAVTSCDENHFMIRSDHWKLNLYDGTPQELFNLAEDPKEHCNLYGDPDHLAKAQELLKWLTETYPGILEETRRQEMYGELRKPKNREKYPMEIWQSVHCNISHSN